MRFFLLLTVILLLFSGCRNNTDYESHLRVAGLKTEAGNLTEAVRLTDSIKLLARVDRNTFLKADSISEIAKRIKLDFALTPEVALAAIEKRAGSVTPEQITEWEEKNWLESRIIDGKKMYFNRSVSNLFLLLNFHSGTEAEEDEELIARKEHTVQILRDSNGKGNLTDQKKIGITYTITVREGAVPENEIVRCWLPYPKSGHTRQENIILKATSQKEYMISPDTAIHSTIYMERKAEKGKPTIFSLEYEYTSSAQWFDPDSIKATPYDRETYLYRNYTSEQLPHIRFHEDVRRLADSICGSGNESVHDAISIWRWFKQNIPWTGAIEYSVIPDLTAYACTNRRGDCGIQTLMFMSMLRYRGIPARWQSGWKVPPYGKNLHDWCEVYFEGTGWVPVDVSYDLQKSNITDLREFFMTGIDSYRLIINDGIAGRLYPEKEYLRSEPYDFQRGEVEWKGGNLYFDNWDYEMKIDYK